MNWMEFAACRGMDIAIFYPGTPDPAKQAAAVAICHTCPVRGTCLNYSLELGEYGDFGVWGGKSERARSKLRSKRRERMTA
jgi:hypothetical protein